MIPITPSYPDVTELLAEFTARVQDALGDELVGLYLSGSLATGDFDPQRSDIDFVAVTPHRLNPDQIAALGAIHAGLITSGQPHAAQLEGAYIPREDFRRYDPQHAEHPGVETGGQFGMGREGIDGIIQRFIVRNNGVTLVGPPPVALIDPIAPDELRRATAGILHEWWLPQLSDTHRIRDREYQAYAVLTMCRILYTLQHARVVSKPSAARWAQDALDAHWQPLIQRALVWRHNDSVNDFSETLELIRYTLDMSQRFTP
jgi:hypothetical protein